MAFEIKAASPSCAEYSLLKLRPGGPKALRTPDQLHGVPDLSPAEQQRLQESAIMLDRSIAAIQITFLSGGHGHFEHPSGAMSWRESSLQEWISVGHCAILLFAACAFGLNIYKTWIFASSFHELSRLASVCDHPAGTHESLAGKRDAHGVYLSRRSAEYPDLLAKQFASIISVFLTPTSSPLTWTDAFTYIPSKSLSDQPRAFVDGGGLHSSPDWSSPPKLAPNIFLNVRQHWLPKLLTDRWRKRVMVHLANRSQSPPYPDALAQAFRTSLNDLLPTPQAFDWSIRPDQPLCLSALATLSRLMEDKDVHLFDALLSGVSTGFDGLDFQFFYRHDQGTSRQTYEVVATHQGAIQPFSHHQEDPGEILGIGVMANPHLS